MAVLVGNDNKDILIDCMCGCDSGIRFKIDIDDCDCYCWMTYTNGQFYTEQDKSVRMVVMDKLKKIWAIIRNKDYYYSEFYMSKKEFDMFRDYLNSIDSVKR